MYIIICRNFVSFAIWTRILDACKFCRVNYAIVGYIPVISPSLIQVNPVICGEWKVIRAASMRIPEYVIKLFCPFRRMWWHLEFDYSHLLIAARRSLLWTRFSVEVRTTKRVDSKVRGVENIWLGLCQHGGGIRRDLQYSYIFRLSCVCNNVSNLGEFPHFEPDYWFCVHFSYPCPLFTGWIAFDSGVMLRHCISITMLHRV